MKRLLLINMAQFSYHTDSYYLCKELKNEFAITYLGRDEKLPKVVEKDVKVIYVLRQKNKLLRFLRLIKESVHFANSGNYDLVIIVYFRLCSLIKIFSRLPSIILDIRTGHIAQNRFIVFLNNKLILYESNFFKNVTIISEGLRKLLNIPPKKTYILPVGAAKISTENRKEYKEIKALYVGTLFSRNIHETIDGFTKFYQEYKDKLNISYDIVGFGSNEEENIIKDRIHEYSMEGVINFHGRVQYNKLKHHFNNCNLGIAYIPIKKHFENQPATKIFEYLLSGIPVIATKTKENTIVINDQNGVLIEDNAESFYSGLVEIYKCKNKYDSELIRLSSEKYSWDAIYNESFRKYLRNI
jgi:glycosyltransferase involved in cell wall biosynthesis